MNVLCACYLIVLPGNQKFDKQISVSPKNGDGNQRRYDNRAPGSTVEVLPRP